jgi:cytochrome c peroxidase
MNISRLVWLPLALVASGAMAAIPPKWIRQCRRCRACNRLRGMLPPDPSGTEGGRKVDLMTDYVLNRSAAILLGKALFWDMEVGSDGATACASCHYHAGVDHRITNQLNPGQAHTNANVASIFNKPFVASDIPGDVASYATCPAARAGRTTR